MDLNRSYPMRGFTKGVSVDCTVGSHWLLLLSVNLGSYGQSDHELQTIFYGIGPSEIKGF